MKMIDVVNVTMRFKLANDKIQSLKEYFIAVVTKKLRYKELCVFEDLSFEINRGEVVGIIGRNGAGKSTLLKIISGVLAPTEGSVQCYGNIVPMLELGSGFDIELSGRENIFLNGSILGYSKKFLEEKYQEIVDFSELEKFIEEPIRNYSSGMLMRLAFSVATIVHPEILIVDEILAVGDEAFQRKSKRKMLELMGGGTTVLFVSHSIDQIREMCSRVIWIENGHIEKIGDPKEVCDSYQCFLDPDYDDYIKNNKNVRNVDAFKHMMDVLIVYNQDEISYYNAIARKEQLLIGNICAHEICVEDLNLEILSQYRMFLFINCNADLVELYVNRINKKNKVYIAECHSKSIIDQWLRKYPAAIVTTNEAALVSCENIYFIPTAITERLQQVATWAKYDKEVLPFKNIAEIDGEQELINYNKSVMEQRKHAEDGIRVGIIVSSISNKKSELEEIVIIRGYTLCWICTKDYEELIREISKMDCVIIADWEEQKNQVNEMLCNLVGVTCFGALQNIQHFHNILDDIAKERDSFSCCRLTENYTTINTGFEYTNFIKRFFNESVTYLFKQFTSLDNCPQIKNLVLKNLEQKMDITVLSSSTINENSLQFVEQVSFVNRSTKYIFGAFDTVVVVDCEEFPFIVTYANIKKKVYYVSRWEPDQFDCGDFSRIRACQSYSPCVPVEFWTNSSLVKDWLEKRYLQKAILI